MGQRQEMLSMGSRVRLLITKCIAEIQGRAELLETPKVGSGQYLGVCWTEHFDSRGCQGLEGGTGVPRGERRKMSKT